MSIFGSTIDSLFGSDDPPEGARPFSVEEVGSHLDRNQWQAPFEPAREPAGDVWQDPVTGVVWERDNFVEREFFTGPYHSIDTDGDGHDDTELSCFRGELPDDMVQALREDPDYREAFANVAGPDSGWSVDEITPGAQVCYDPRDGSLTDSGTWDYAAPQAFQYDEHEELDIDRHDQFNTYETQFENVTSAHDSGPSHAEPAYDPPSSDYGGGSTDGGGSSSAPD
jgi:hypothetical protein